MLLNLVDNIKSINKRNINKDRYLRLIIVIITIIKQRQSVVVAERPPATICHISTLNRDCRHSSINCACNNCSAININMNNGMSHVNGACCDFNVNSDCINNNMNNVKVQIVVIGNINNSRNYINNYSRSNSTIRNNNFVDRSLILNNGNGSNEFNIK